MAGKQLVQFQTYTTLRNGTRYHTGNGYYFKIHSNRGNKRYLICVERGCSVRGTIDSELRGKISSVVQHNHAPKHEEPDVECVRRRIRERCSVEALSNRKIYEDEISRVSPKVASHLKFSSIMRDLQKQRGMNQSVITISLDSYTDATSNTTNFTCDDTQFLDELGNVEVMFETPDLKFLPYEVAIEENYLADGYDGIIFISVPNSRENEPVEIQEAVAKGIKINKAVESDGGVLEVNLPAGRLIYTPILINLDVDDVRSFGEAGKASMQRALKAGVTESLVVLSPYSEFRYTQLVTILGVFEALYVNMQYREDRPEACPRLKKVGFCSTNAANLQEIVQTAIALEKGRWISRDIGTADPGKMTPIKVEEYVRETFSHSPVKIDVISDLDSLSKEFPLFATVNKTANDIMIHRGRIIILTYKDQVPKETLFVVGKCVTYDTCRTDIMSGLSRDKCGAAGVAGFLKVVSELKPKHKKVVGIMAVVRNNACEKYPVANEIIQSRSGLRVRIGNTDTDGRLILSDALCYAKEKALKSVNPYLLTITTASGRSNRTGSGYTVVTDNRAAKKFENWKLSEEIGDPFEICTVHREDYELHRGKFESEDVLQASIQQLTGSRGHQESAAYFILISELDKHGVGSEFPIKYSHLDITESVGNVPEDTTGSPVLALSVKFLNNHFASLADQ